ncbi:hypothetical protein TPA0598_08_00050 [Streptomyces lydicamycinicus]|uniref:Uncharacterized protein n=1 Tax=Streptomyces lydicamycinicus TaxID=1546107 RepID=A0A0P4RD37_9ACTN|nr:hypothetical protein TPA0598_08_00050 [Streptomyces lydicamycinicus]
MAITHKAPVHPISRPLRVIARFAMPVAALAVVTTPSAAHAAIGGPEDPDLLAVRPVTGPSLALTAEGPAGSTVFSLRPLTGDAEGGGASDGRFGYTGIPAQRQPCRDL